MLRRLRGARSGVAAVEFGLVAPLVLMTMMGLFDMGYTIYTSVLLEGAIQETARQATIEGSYTKTSELDEQVTSAVQAIAPSAQLSFKRTAYTSFSDIGRPEDFTDVNKDGRCDGGEPFEDANGNGTWDQDRGKAGSGGARDAVLYEVPVTFDRPFPIAGFLGTSPSRTLVARTVLRNQPYDLGGKTVKVATCA